MQRISCYTLVRAQFIDVWKVVVRRHNQYNLQTSWAALLLLRDLNQQTGTWKHPQFTRETPPEIQQLDFVIAVFWLIVDQIKDVKWAVKVSCKYNIHLQWTFAGLRKKNSIIFTLITIQLLYLVISVGTWGGNWNWGFLQDTDDDAKL